MNFDGDRENLPLRFNGGRLSPFLPLSFLQRCTVHHKMSRCLFLICSVFESSQSRKPSKTSRDPSSSKRQLDQDWKLHGTRNPNRLAKAPLSSRVVNHGNFSFLFSVFIYSFRRIFFFFFLNKV